MSVFLFLFFCWFRVFSFSTIFSCTYNFVGLNTDNAKCQHCVNSTIDPYFDTFSISVDPDGMPHYEIFHLGLHSLPKYAYIGITIINKASNAVVRVFFSFFFFFGGGGGIFI